MLGRSACLCGQEINLTLEDAGTPHTGKSKIVLSVEARPANFRPRAF